MKGLDHPALLQVRKLTKPLQNLVSNGGTPAQMSSENWLQKAFHQSESYFAILERSSVKAVQVSQWSKAKRLGELESQKE